MAHRSIRRRFRPTGVGSYTANSSHPFNERFFEDLDRRLAADPAARPTPPVVRPSPFPPARA